MRTSGFRSKIKVITTMDILYTILSSAVTALVFVAGWSVTVGRKLQIMDDLKDGLEKIKKDIDKIREDIKMLIDRVSKLEGKMEGVIGRSSPLSPTALGARYIKESGLAAILDDKGEKELLREKLKADLPKNYSDYDVQESSRRILFSLKDDPMMRPVKEYAFQNGLEVEVILGAAALWLRDDFMGVSRKISPEKEESK